MSELNTSFPKISLTAARVNANLTQKELATKCGVSESTVTAWETGRRFPNLKMLDKIETAVGMSLNYIRFGN